MLEHAVALADDTQEAHLRLLWLIEQHPDYTQRRLASAMGVSLGKTHYLLKALFDKGLVKSQRFTKSPTKMNYLYVLTPSGVKSRIEMTKSFLQHKEREFDILKAEIERLRRDIDQSSTTL